MKKILAIMVGICMALCFSACSNESEETGEPVGAEVDLDTIVESIEMEEGFQPQIGIVLGSGLHPLADEVDVVQTIPYEDLPGFPRSTVEGHQGQYVLGYLDPDGWPHPLLRRIQHGGSRYSGQGHGETGR